MSNRMLLPAQAAWRHQFARDGFEIVFFKASESRLICEGCTAGIEDGRGFWVEYTIELDTSWCTRRALIRNGSQAGRKETLLISDGPRHWWINGRAAPELEGCFDVDLESSAFTNAFPMNRLALSTGDKSGAPAAWVRAFDLSVERLEQSYVRLPDSQSCKVFDYDAPSNAFQCKLVYDRNGLVLDYPGIAVRVA